jgi:hypothetical protein
MVKDNVATLKCDIWMLMDRWKVFGLAASRGIALRAQPARFGGVYEGGYRRYYA